MKNVLAIVASNKRVSINKILLLYAANKLSHVKVHLLSLSEIVLPVYNEELETNQGIPAAVETVYRRFTEADGFILACPEHNGLPPAGFKNLHDWLSRINQQVFQQKPVLLLSTSTGMNGGASNLQLMKHLLPKWGGQPAGMFSLGDFYNNFNCAEIKINDPVFEAQLADELKLFEAGFVDNLQTA